MLQSCTLVWGPSAAVSVSGLNGNTDEIHREVTMFVDICATLSKGRNIMALLAPAHHHLFISLVVDGRKRRTDIVGPLKRTGIAPAAHTTGVS